MRSLRATDQTQRKERLRQALQALNNNPEKFHDIGPERTELSLAGPRRVALPEGTINSYDGSRIYYILLYGTAVHTASSVPQGNTGGLLCSTPGRRDTARVRCRLCHIQSSRALQFVSHGKEAIHVGYYYYSACTKMVNITRLHADTSTTCRRTHRLRPVTHSGVQFAPVVD